MAADKKLERVAYRKALMDLRDKYISELEPTILMLIELRDNEEVPAKERINAAKELKVWLGVARPAEEKQPSAPVPGGGDAAQQAAAIPQHILDMADKVIKGGK